ncbi:MAG TPA: 50S ribosomal protein L15 [candidate division Zixibacteria bacterium]|jgi:large subunit ribosomal protein L15|nr:50S ribosomal protein L15 [candidate division Zixibacteria bacterium]
MRLSDIRPARGAVKKRKRLGCGTGSGHGGTSTKGHKGQKSRAGSGAKVPAWFEGGQMPLQRRLPKRGFTSRNKTAYQLVDVGSLAKLSDLAEITPQGLLERKLIRPGKGPVKIMGGGQLKTALKVSAHAFTGSARAKIEEAGGTATVVAAGRF